MIIFLPLILTLIVCLLLFNVSIPLSAMIFSGYVIVSFLVHKDLPIYGERVLLPRISFKETPKRFVACMCFPVTMFVVSLLYFVGVL